MLHKKIGRVFHHCALMTLIALFMAPISAQATASPDNRANVAAQLRCSALSTDPNRVKAFTIDLSFAVADTSMTAHHPTVRKRGSETFTGRFNESGLFIVTGAGNYNGGSVWKYEFAGRISTKRRPVLTGVMTVTQGSTGQRHCSIAFEETGAKLKDQLSEITALKREQTAIAESQERTQTRVSAVVRLLDNIVLPVTERPEDWMLRVAAVPVQQQQFCRIVDRFYDRLAEVYRARNDIRFNSLYRDRQRDMVALLPGGRFENWVVRVLEVTQARDGSAAVVLQLPCRALLGSNACSTSKSKIGATIATDSPIYRELEHVKAGDFVVVSGRLAYASEQPPGQPLPEYAVYRAGSYCSTAQGGSSQDVFVTEIGYLARLQ